MARSVSAGPNRSSPTSTVKNAPFVARGPSPPAQQCVSKRGLPIPGTSLLRTLPVLASHKNLLRLQQALADRNGQLFDKKGFYGYTKIGLRKEDLLKQAFP